MACAPLHKESEDGVLYGWVVQVVVESLEPEKMILYPHVFWGCVALLHTDFVHAFRRALELLSRVIQRLSFQDRTTENVLLASMPDSAPPDAGGWTG